MKPLALALTLLASAPALAEPVVATQASPQLPLTLSLDSHTRWYLDRGYRLFGVDRSETQGGFSASFQVARLARGTLEVGAGYHGTSNRNTFAGQHEAVLDENSPSLSALLRWSPYRWLEPHLRIAADLTRMNLRLDMSNGSVYEDTVWSPGGSAGAGLRLRSGVLTTGLRGGKLGLAGALIIEGGFQVGAPLDFEVARPAPADEKLKDDRIPAAPTPLGVLDRTHPYLRVSFALLI